MKGTTMATPTMKALAARQWPAAHYTKSNPMRLSPWRHRWQHRPELPAGTTVTVKSPDRGQYRATIVSFEYHTVVRLPDGWYEDVYVVRPEGREETERAGTGWMVWPLP
jgi:hypothetical protein